MNNMISKQNWSFVVSYPIAPVQSSPPIPLAPSHTLEIAQLSSSHTHTNSLNFKRVVYRPPKYYDGNHAQNLYNRLLKDGRSEFVLNTLYICLTASPSILKGIGKHFRFGRQEDAHEFLRYTIEGIQKSCLAGKPK